MSSGGREKLKRTNKNPLNIPENKTYDKNAGPTPRRDIPNRQNT